MSPFFYYNLFVVLSLPHLSCPPPIFFVFFSRDQQRVNGKKNHKKFFFLIFLWTLILLKLLLFLLCFCFFQVYWREGKKYSCAHKISKRLFQPLNTLLHTGPRHRRMGRSWSVWDGDLFMWNKVINGNERDQGREREVSYWFVDCRWSIVFLSSEFKSP